LSSICDVPGFRVGHCHDLTARTGCTVILPPGEATAGVDVRGSAPGTREIEVCKPVRLVPKIHAVLLTGGSAFGLDAAGGVQKYLEEQNIGYETGIVKVPIVPAAVIFDLGVGNPSVRPDHKMGYQSCLNATAQERSQGPVGAGCGATVGKFFGQNYASPGGIGTCSQKIGAVCIGVLSVVNPLGEVINPENGEILAGIKKPDRTDFIPSLTAMKSLTGHKIPSANTTLSVVATNVQFSKEECIKIAQMAQDGLARTIRPAHTMYDGDIVFALSAGTEKMDVNLAGAIACELVAESIVRAVQEAN